jgi:broad specificity phosphatase PhoE
MKHNICVLTLTTAKIVSNYQRTKAEYEDRLREYQEVQKTTLFFREMEYESIASFALDQASQELYQSERILKVHWAHLWQRYRNLMQEYQQQPPQWFFTELLAVNEALCEVSKVVSG